MGCITIILITKKKLYTLPKIFFYSKMIFSKYFPPYFTLLYQNFPFAIFVKDALFTLINIKNNNYNSTAKLFIQTSGMRYSITNLLTKLFVYNKIYQDKTNIN